MVPWLDELFREFGAATIRLEAVEFLGTLYPIGIIAGLVEVRAITSSPRVRMKFGVFSRPSAGWIALLTLPAFSSLWLLADAVIKQMDIRGWSAVWVVFAGTMLFSGLAAGVVELVWVAFVEDARKSTPRQETTTASSPQPAKPRKNSNNPTGKRKRKRSSSRKRK